MPRFRAYACASNATNNPVTSGFRIRRMRPGQEAAAVSRLWKEALLLPGLTSYGKVHDDAESASLESRMAEQMQGLSMRRHQARQMVVEDRAAAVVAATKAAEEEAATAAAALVLLPGGDSSKLADIKPGALLQALADKVPTMVQTSNEPVPPKQPLSNPHRSAKFRRYRLWTCLVAVADTNDSSSATALSITHTTASAAPTQPKSLVAAATTAPSQPLSVPIPAPQWLWGSLVTTPPSPGKTESTQSMWQQAQQILQRTAVAQQQQQQQQQTNSSPPSVSHPTPITTNPTANKQHSDSIVSPGVQNAQLEQARPQLQNDGVQLMQQQPPHETDTRSLSSSPEILGYIVLSMQQPQAMFPPPWPSNSPYHLFIDGFAVSPARRRQGVGQALLAAAEKLCARQGMDQVWLSVDESNSAALGMYRATGFSEGGQGEFRFRWGEDMGLLMRKAIPKQDRKTEVSRAGAGKAGGVGSGGGGGGKGVSDSRGVVLADASLGYVDKDGVWIWKSQPAKVL